MWERFSYYGMRALLVLYMIAAVSDGGMGTDNKYASWVYGLYTMSVYLASVPGGLIADKYLGSRYAVLIGGIIIALGHFSMAVPNHQFFYAGLVLIVLGTGLLKPNISTMLGSLYKEGDPRRDAGFSIFYMGINIGAALSPLVCGFLAQSNEFKSFLESIGLPGHTSWHWEFGCAGVGMMVGLIHYVLQWKTLGDAGLRPKKIEIPSIDDKNGEHNIEQSKEQSEEQSKNRTTESEDSPKTTDETNQPMSETQWKRLGAIGILFFFNVLFWAVYEHGGSSLNVFADKCTNTLVFGWNFPSSWLQSLQAAFVIVLAPLLSALWIRMGDKQPSSPEKFTWGLLFLGLGIAIMVPASMLAAKGLVSPLWLAAVYLIEVIGELCLSPVGLSTVTKLAPPKYLGLTMGLWFWGMAAGNLLAGLLATYFDEEDTGGMVVLFGAMAAAAIIGALVLFLLAPRVKRLMGNIK